MRKIKFRAWDENSQEMIYEVGITPEGIPYSIPENAEGCDQFNYFLTCHKMQYTGLKDKNGREIYEGDIIHCVHWFFDGNEIEEHFTASVGFRDGSFTLEDIDCRYYSDYTGEENGKGICWIGDINYCEEDYEVIGNIYENPELLEASHVSK
ncbi:YopX family protein [Bacillus atrophaeus]|uniref:YopX family protein n=1 Tax=Bacillus atrophaeus TaxID=1452 RepID=UPI002DBD7621|nr:YopX family protein [Bacillus atrophaeus]MEC1900996.1 YopX family protein [Bacillus atrophaeus]MEC2396161.1 YopX family protein [Bacillus atrophaeus]MED4437333.1 YopX family protein [Bacillus atrophaeus]MED4567077.1 YopX family protein [Bacillus atrophaeus]MED4573399.1 YopX family protein [Bacillus atrophaeus]